MSISYPSQGIPVVGADIVTTIPAVATSTLLMAQNPNRSPNCLIINNSNKNLWILLAPTPATTASPSIKIPPLGGAFDIPGGYTGVVAGIWEAAPNGSCVVHEFSYL